MSNKSIQPSTLEGIKRLAKSIKADQRLQHSRALDLASEAAGYTNFRNATKTLNSACPKRSYKIFLTASWKKGDFKGRETLTMELSSPLEDLITSDQLRNHRAFENFYYEGPDHLARYKFLGSQSEARRLVCAAARVLQFMDATKLRISTGYRRAYPKGDISKAIPGKDHGSVWYDSSTRRYLLVDEPYVAPVERLTKEREAWAKQYGFQVVKPEWTGMYAPDVGSRLYLIADETKGISLQPIKDALNKLAPPIVEAAWNGMSAPHIPFFVSPGSIAKAAVEKDKPKNIPKQSKPRNSVSYRRGFVGSSNRPKGRMPIEIHTQVGHLLKSVLKDSYNRKGVYNRLTMIRSELDEWAQHEYNHDELPNEQFFNLYYRESGSTFLRVLAEADRERHIQSLIQVKELLSEHYLDSSPLRLLLGKVDATVKLMCAELAGDFHLGDSRQLTDKSLLPFDLVS